MMDGDNRILRQRRQRETGVIFDKPVESPLSRAVKRLDFYPKVHRERVKKQTLPGMTISIAVTAIIVMMLIAEAVSYIWGWEAYHDRLSVDSGVTQDVMVNLNFTFHNLKCHALHMDAADAAGVIRVNVHSGLYKSPVDRNGKLIFSVQHPHRAHEPLMEEEEPDSEDFVSALSGGDYDVTKDPSSPHFCGPCEIYPVANMASERKRKRGEKVKCCNTCTAVLDHYKEKKERIPEKAEIEQCIHEESVKHPGCNIAGFIMVEKVRGKFEFAPGGVRRVGFRMLHTFSEQQEIEFDITHTINHLSFGDPAAKNLAFLSAQTHPLDGSKYVVPRDKLGRRKYIIKAIPVVYADHATLEESAEEGDDVTIAGGEEKATSFEISVKSHSTEFVPVTSRHVPALSFEYDFFHMQITHVYQRLPITRFLLNVCKIIGGLFVVTGIIDRVVSKFVSMRLV